jgi:hypothetical protein
MEAKNQPKSKAQETVSADDIKTAQKVAAAQLEAQLKQVKAVLKDVMDSDIDSFAQKYIADGRFELLLKLKNAQALEQIAYELHAANNPSKAEESTEDEETDETDDGDIE